MATFKKAESRSNRSCTRSLPGRQRPPALILIHGWAFLSLDFLKKIKSPQICEMKIATSDNLLLAARARECSDGVCFGFEFELNVKF